MTRRIVLGGLTGLLLALAFGGGAPSAASTPAAALAEPPSITTIPGWLQPPAAPPAGAKISPPSTGDGGLKQINERPLDAALLGISTAVLGIGLLVWSRS